MKIKSFECPKSIRNYEKKYLEHQTLGRRVICPREPANQRIILQIVGFQFLEPVVQVKAAAKKNCEESTKPPMICAFSQKNSFEGFAFEQNIYRHALKFEGLTFFFVKSKLLSQYIIIVMLCNQGPFWQQFIRASSLAQSSTK